MKTSKPFLITSCVLLLNIGQVSHSMDTDSSYIRYFIRNSQWLITDSKVSGDGLTSVITSTRTINYIRNGKIECYKNWSSAPVWFHLIGDGP